MDWKVVETNYARIYLAGEIEIAKQALREECILSGLCVTIHPTEYIYTGGQETGFVVELLNYPRFPSAPEELLARAKDLALKLRDRCCQLAVMVVTPQQTFWMKLEPPR